MTSQLSKPSKMISRFAPSPTGYLHIGNIRIALLNWLFTRKNGGEFILRIDDTDRERSQLHFETQIKEDLQWLGITWDRSFRQSDQFALYQQAKEQLIASGRLYPCYETQEELTAARARMLAAKVPPIYDRTGLRLSAEERLRLEAEGRKPHWRFLIDRQAKVAWHDLVVGSIVIDPKKLSDPILFKDDGAATYTLATVVDDIYSGVNTIIRGADHITNSAVQSQMFVALMSGAAGAAGTEAAIPQFAHIPLVYGKDQEMSKRTGGFDIKSLRESGIEPLAITSMMATLGTANNIEAYSSIDELIAITDMAKVSLASVQYDPELLATINLQIIRRMDYDQVVTRLRLLGKNGGDEQEQGAEAHAELPREFWEIIRGNIGSLAEAVEWWQICRDPRVLCSSFEPETAEFLRQAAELLPTEELPELIWEKWISAIKATTERRGKELFTPLRLAITGRERGPEMAQLLRFIPRNVLRLRLCGE